VPKFGFGASGGAPHALDTSPGDGASSLQGQIKFTAIPKIMVKQGKTLPRGAFGARSWTRRPGWAATPAYRVSYRCKSNIEGPANSTKADPVPGGVTAFPCHYLASNASIDKLWPLWRCLSLSWRMSVVAMEQPRTDRMPIAEGLARTAITIPDTWNDDSCVHPLLCWHRGRPNNPRHDICESTNRHRSVERHQWVGELGGAANGRRSLDANS
jgi:hypothetical protein